MLLLLLLIVTPMFSIELCLFSRWKQKISCEEFYHIDLYISQHWLPRIDFFSSIIIFVRQSVYISW